MIINEAKEARPKARIAPPALYPRKKSMRTKTSLKKASRTLFIEYVLNFFIPCRIPRLTDTRRVKNKEKPTNNIGLIESIFKYNAIKGLESARRMKRIMP